MSISVSRPCMCVGGGCTHPGHLLTSCMCALSCTCPAVTCSKRGDKSSMLWLARRKLRASELCLAAEGGAVSDGLLEQLRQEIDPGDGGQPL